ncbi:hypothetical protein ACFWNN_34320 [Lentzea sp. NPDC058450]|uniref:hypothetical protein n=1 Tax=Lentzea sp. NPDC058450 TaxID=3346505 RepID=UPI003647BA43
MWYPFTRGYPSNEAQEATDGSPLTRPTVPYWSQTPRPFVQWATALNRPGRPSSQ